MRKTSSNDNWVKYDLNVKGLSGKLKTTIIGDYLTHAELLILEQERQEYFKQKEALQAISAKSNTAKAADGAEEKQKKAAEDYIPVDFDAYSIPDRETAEAQRAELEPLPEKEKICEFHYQHKIWRISSLTTFVDADTKILLLPLPESKRPVKIQDTKYAFNTYGDLLAKHEELKKVMKSKEEKNVRFEDKTSEEISQDIRKKRVNGNVYYIAK